MNKRLYRLSGRTAIAYAGQSILRDGLVHTQPTEDMLYAAGYRPMGEAQRPEYDAEREYLRAAGYRMSEDGEELVPVWEIAALPGMQDARTIEQRVADLEAVVVNG